MIRLFLVTLGWACAASANAAVVDYSYVADNEVDLTIPSISGDPGCSGSSAENPNDANQYVIRDTGGLSNLDTTSWTEYFLCPGDYTSAGTTTFTRNCSETTPCWLIYYSPTDPGTHPGTWDWDSSERTHLEDLDPSGASWWRFVRVQWGMFNPAYTPGSQIPLSGGTGTTIIARCSRPGEGSTDIVYHEIVCEGTSGHAMGTGSSGANDRITIQRSVIRHMEIQASTDVVGVNIMSADDFHVISSELYGWTDALHLETQTSLRTIFENNDIYIPERMFTDCSSSTSAPVQDPNGECACFENMLDFKDVGEGDALSDSETVVKGNRIRNMRFNHDPCGASGSNGGMTISMSLASEPKYKVKFWDNLFWGFDFPSSITENQGRLWSDTGDTSANHSFIGNLVEHESGGESNHLFPPLQDTEFFLNTVVNAEWFMRLNDSRTNDTGSLDAMCNTFINVPTPWVNTNLLSASAVVGYNAYINSGSTLESNVDANSDYEQATLANMNFDDLRVEYNLITESASPPTKTFTQVVPTSSTPQAYLDLCPGTSENDTMGERTGVGVDDDTADWTG